MIKRSIILTTVSCLLIAGIRAVGQPITPSRITTSYDATGRINDARVITTSVPFLGITPDARSAGIGDAGTALSGDQNAVYWNPGRLARVTKDIGGSISITPWLRGLGVNDVYLGYLSGHYKINKQSAVGLGFTYFNLGSIQMTDNVGQNLGTLNPNELAICPTYSRILSKNLSLGIGIKYFHSNLAGSYSGGTDATRARPANSVAVDLGMFYTKDISLGGNPAQFAFGAVLSNMGPKISYTDNNKRDFIPSTLRIGPALTMELDPYNKVTFTFDVAKTLVPTPAKYDSLNPQIQNLGWIEGMAQSLYKAPDGFREKIQELMIGGGAEYWYDNQFAVRGGYFHESKNKGNRRYFTAGVGIRYQTFGLDFAYLIPVASNHPLAETLRFSLLFDLNLAKKEESVTDKADGPGAE
jgi:Type IX secretion system protein PorV